MKKLFQLTIKGEKYLVWSKTDASFHVRKIIKGLLDHGETAHLVEGEYTHTLNGDLKIATELWKSRYKHFAVMIERIY